MSTPSDDQPRPSTRPPTPRHAPHGGCSPRTTPPPAPATPRPWLLPCPPRPLRDHVRSSRRFGEHRAPARVEREMCSWSETVRCACNAYPVADVTSRLLEHAAALTNDEIVNDIVVVMNAVSTQHPNSPKSSPEPPSRSCSPACPTSPWRCRPRPWSGGHRSGCGDCPPFQPVRPDLGAGDYCVARTGRTCTSGRRSSTRRPA